MANEGSFHVKAEGLQPSSTDPRLLALRQGWLDVWGAKPPDPRFDAVPEQVSGSYENGRLLAATAMAAGYVAPAWPEGGGLPDWWPDMRNRFVGDAVPPRIEVKLKPKDETHASQ